MRLHYNTTPDEEFQRRGRIVYKLTRRERLAVMENAKAFERNSSPYNLSLAKYSSTMYVRQSEPLKGGSSEPLNVQQQVHSDRGVWQRFWQPLRIWVTTPPELAGLVFATE